ncbi:unnamed protein product [Malus baccata var. baccata]
MSIHCRFDVCAIENCIALSLCIGKHRLRFESRLRALFADMFYVELLFLSYVGETPFRPREQLYEKQKIFQSIHKHTYLKGPYDKITSVAIPAALAATSLFLIGRGIYNMSHGIGKKE